MDAITQICNSHRLVKGRAAGDHPRLRKGENIAARSYGSTA
jgi:hypothetical protein